MAHGTDFLSFVLLCHLMMFRPLTFYNPNNRHPKNLMLKKSHVFSRGDVLANALKSERNTEATWIRASFALPPAPALL